MTIRAKILIPMIILTLVSAGAILISNIIQFSTYVNTSINDRVDNASAVAEDKFETLKKEAYSASIAIAENNSIIKLVEAADRDGLMTLAKRLQEENDMELCIIADAKGTILIRTHVPEKYGDDGSAIPTVKAALSGGTLTTAEIGAAIPMAISSGSPIHNDDGEIIGAMVLGTRLDTDSFVDSIKSLLGCEVTIFAGDTRISTTVVKDDGTRATGTQAAKNVSEMVLTGNTYSGQAVILNQNALAKYTPIYDNNKNVIGMLFVGRYTTEASQTIWTFISLGLVIVLLLLATSIPTILYIAKRIVTPINHMVDAATALAAGNTDIKITVDTKDEMSNLEKAFNEMIDNTRKQVSIIKKISEGDLTVSVEERSDKDIMNRALKAMLVKNNEAFAQITAASNQVSTGSHQIASISQDLAQSSSEQSGTLENLLSAINEITDKTKDNAKMSSQAADLSSDIKNNAEKSSEQMSEMMQAVNDINDASSEINKVIKVIDDIAFQTNILALNAAVEAARAGEHGKGFAVVAEEVRNLAAKSAEAAKGTGQLIINSIQKAETGVQIANQTSESLIKIVEGINKNNRIVDDIAKSSEVQSQAITQINKGVDEVVKLVQSNSANAQEGAAVSEEMSSQAIALEGLISQFKINKDAANL